MYGHKVRKLFQIYILEGKVLLIKWHPTDLWLQTIAVLIPLKWVGATETTGSSQATERQQCTILSIGLEMHNYLYTNVIHICENCNGHKISTQKKTKQ